MPSKVPTNIIPANILGVTSWRRTKFYRFYGCFNFLNIYTTTKWTWNFMLDTSTIQFVQLQNAHDILCWMLQLTQHIQLQNKWGFERKQLQNECKYKKVGPTPLFCTKRPLAGNLYCPSPPLYVPVIWSRMEINNAMSMMSQFIIVAEWLWNVVHVQLLGSGWFGWFHTFWCQGFGRSKRFEVGPSTITICNTCNGLRTMSYGRWISTVMQTVSIMHANAIQNGAVYVKPCIMHKGADSLQPANTLL